MGRTTLMAELHVNRGKQVMLWQGDGKVWMGTKNRPHWRLRDRRGRRKGDPVPLPEPRADLHAAPRCQAIARRTGERCRAPAMQGAKTCRCHGGHMQAYRSAVKQMGAERVYSVRSVEASPRDALGRIGAEGEYPPGVPYAVSPVVRGLIIEAWRNRDMDPNNFLQWTKKAGCVRE